MRGLSGLSGLSGLITSAVGGGGWTPASLSDVVIWAEASPSYCFSDGLGTVPCNHNDYVRTWRDAKNGDIIFYTSVDDNAPVFKVDGSKYYLDLHTPHNYLLANAADGDLSALFINPAATACYGYLIDVGADFTAIGQTGVSSSNQWDRFAGASSYQAILRAVRHESQPVIPTGYITHTARSDETVYTRRINGVEDINHTGSWGTNAVNQWVIGYNGAGSGDAKGRIYGLIVTNSYVDDATALLIETYLNGLMQ